jgi:hypothetical protein
LVAAVAEMVSSPFVFKSSFVMMIDPILTEFLNATNLPVRRLSGYPI